MRWHGSAKKAMCSSQWFKMHKLKGSTVTGMGLWPWPLADESLSVWITLPRARALLVMYMGVCHAGCIPGVNQGRMQDEGPQAGMPDVK